MRSISLNKGTRLYHIANTKINSLKAIRTYFGLSPIGAVFMAPVDSFTSHALNLKKRLYALTLSRDTTFQFEKEVGSNFIGLYLGNPAALHLQKYGYKLQELIIDNPTEHQWEMVTDRAGKMPSVQMFLTKYPVYKSLGDIDFLPLQDLTYSFFHDDWDNIKSNFKMKQLLELDDAQIASGKNKANSQPFLPLDSQMNSYTEKIIEFASSKMALKSSEWNDLLKNTKIILYSRGNIDAPSYLKLDAPVAATVYLLPKMYTVSKKEKESDKVIILKKERKKVIQQIKNLNEKINQDEDNLENIWSSLSEKEQEEEGRKLDLAHEKIRKTIEDLQKKQIDLKKQIRVEEEKKKKLKF